MHQPAHSVTQHRLSDVFCRSLITATTVPLIAATTAAAHDWVPWVAGSIIVNQVWNVVVFKLEIQTQPFS